MLRLMGVLIVGVTVLGILGCGTGPSLDTVPVSGTVKLDGTPVSGAKVVFAPASAGGMAASGVTDSNGVYKLTTRDPDDGAMAGSYLVMISKTEGGPDPASEAVKPGMTDEEATKAAMEARDAAGGAEVTVKDVLPVKYKSPADSGLKADVSESQTQFDFDLVSDGAAPAQSE